jgi:hypothetical protein
VWRTTRRKKGTKRMPGDKMKYMTCIQLVHDVQQRLLTQQGTYGARCVEWREYASAQERREVLEAARS